MSKPYIKEKYKQYSLSIYSTENPDQDLVIIRKSKKIIYKKMAVKTAVKFIVATWESTVELNEKL